MASPGDLEVERDSLRNLERRMNALFRDRGVRVSIVGWEEVQPEVGRPQALINPLVHECEIFIGLLSARWGSSTGTHTSGFEEEFEIALARRRSEGDRPAIGMFFRSIEAERLADQGPQLAAVLKFQERVRSERLALYKSFRGADDLALEIFDFLAPYALRLAEEIALEGLAAGNAVTGSTPADDKPAEVGMSVAEVRTSEDILANAEAPYVDSAQRQILEALNEMSKMFVDAQPFDQAVRDRITLVGTAFSKDPGILNIHHVNRLYGRRADIDLTLGEFRVWCRTYFENTGTFDRKGRTVPIWGVLKTHDWQQLINEISDILRDEDAPVVRGVLRFMTDHGIRPEALWPQDRGRGSTKEAEPPSTDETAALWSQLFNQFPGIDVAINYMTALVNERDTSLLASITTSTDVDEETRLLVGALARLQNDEYENLEQFAPSVYRSEDTSSIRRLLIDVMPKLAPGQWDAMLKGSHESISVAAAVQLIKREPVTERQLRAILVLEDFSVRDALLERASRESDWAIEKIGMLKESDETSSGDLISRLLAVSSPPEVLDSLSEREHVSITCWVARTMQDPEAFVDAAREVLDGDSAFLMSRIAPLQERYAAVAKYLTATAKAAACEVLARAGDVEDDITRVADEVRRDHYASRRSAVRALVHLVTRFSNAAGRPSPDLGDLSTLDCYMSAREIDYVLNSPLAEKVVPLWRESDIAALRTAGSSWELQQGNAADEVLEEALYRDDEVVRLVALDQLLARWDTEQITDLLMRYSKSNRAYWYNVIAALDERLYGYSSAQEAMSVESED